MRIRIKRIYETPSRTDGVRVLVDRLWPRGVSKSQAGVDVWAKMLAPSTELRKWFAHDPTKFAEFAVRYRTELQHSQSQALERYPQLKQGKLTLLYAARDPSANHAVVLQAWLQELLLKEK